MIVVSNATPLIAMAIADRFDLLQKIFGRIYIPQGVYEEVVEEGGERFGAADVRQAAWIQVIEAKDKLAVEVLEDDLGKGVCTRMCCKWQENPAMHLADDGVAGEQGGG